MRKIKNDRNKKKLNNSLDNFYEQWAKVYNLQKDFSKMSNKEITKVTNNLKRQIDFDYIRLRVDEKFMYFINLYKIYEMICIYFEIPNKFLKKYDVIPDDNETIEEKLGYEVAFSNKVKVKSNDIAHWLFSTLEIIKKYYSVIPRDSTFLQDNIEKIIITSELKLVKQNIEIKEKNILNTILIRVEYSRRNIDVIFGCVHLGKDKILRKMIKSCLTKVEHTLNLIME